MFPGPLLLLAYFVLIFLPFGAQLVLLVPRLLELKGVSHSRVEGSCSQARLILEGHCHEGAQTGDPIEVHARLTDHLLDENVLKLGYNVVCCITANGLLSSLVLSVTFSFIAAFLSGSSSLWCLTATRSEDGMRNALVVLEQLALHELVALTRIKEPDQLRNALATVNVCTVVISIPNRFSWALQTADVDTSSRTRVVLKELSQIIQFVTQVMC